MFSFGLAHTPIMTNLFNKKMRNLLLVLLVLFFLTNCSGQKYKISTENMSPALKIGDVCKAENNENIPIQRFDIVVFNMPEDVKKISGEKGNIKIISRIIGLPGEKIKIRQGKTYTNNELLDESFEKIVDTEKDFSVIEIPENEYFLLGDNRLQSLDSRYWKKPTISRKDISGKILSCN